MQGASTADGAKVVQYADWGGGNQQWQLVPVADVGGGSGALPSTFRCDPDQLTLLRRQP